MKLWNICPIGKSIQIHDTPDLELSNPELETNFLKSKYYGVVLILITLILLPI